VPESKLKIEIMPVGSLEANCYIIYEDDSRQAAIIDPGEEAAAILERVKALAISVRFIIHTHGHYDHTGASEALRRQTKARLLIHQADLELVEFTPEGFVRDGEIIPLGKLEFKVLHTPGHTPGGISLVCEDHVFTGDTLFANGVGRTDLTGGNETALWRSIREKLFTLPETYIIYPGHGPASTIGREKKTWKS
jgi:glyoxylase-like metal-dependent hydrolase (beta-lactamase superfamily II)